MRLTIYIKGKGTVHQNFLLFSNLKAIGFRGTHIIISDLFGRGGCMSHVSDIQLFSPRFPTLNPIKPSTFHNLFRGKYTALSQLTWPTII